MCLWSFETEDRRRVEIGVGEKGEEERGERREEGGEESSEESMNDERDYQGFQAAVRRI